MKGEMIRGNKRPKKRYKIVNPKRFYSILAALLLLSIGGTKAITALNSNYALVEHLTKPETTDEAEEVIEEVAEEVVEQPVVEQVEEPIEEPIQDVTVLYTTDNVYIRELPNTSCAKLKLLDKGTRLITEGKYDDDWYIISYKGQPAYINANYVQEKTIQKFIATKEIVEQCGYQYNPELFDYYVELTPKKTVNLRKEPSTNSRTFTKISPGAHLQVLGQDGDWFIAKFFNMTVYVHSSYVKLGIGKKPKGEIKELGYIPEQTIAFEEPDYQKDSLFLAQGEVVEIYGEYGDFYLIKNTDGVGYVQKSAVKKVTEKGKVLIVEDLSTNSATAYRIGEDGSVKVIIEAPTITGKKGHETPTGLAKIIRKYDYRKDGKRHELKGEDENGPYSVEVDYCLKLQAANGSNHFSGINIHTSGDAEDSYGGDKYLSHGCIRSTDELLLVLLDEVVVGDLVYVKR